MEQELDYLQLFNEKLIPTLMKVLSILAIPTFIAGIYSEYYGSIVWSDLYGHYRAFIDIWLPTLPYAIYIFTLIPCGWKDWRFVLLGVPIITVEILPGSLKYMYYYHHNMGNLYYPGQAFSLLSLIVIPLGLILLILSTMVFYKKHDKKILALCQKAKNFIHPN